MILHAEIDILEAVDTETTAYSTLHFNGLYGGSQTGGSAPVDGLFHTYRLECAPC